MIDPETIEADFTIPQIERILRGITIIRKYTDDDHLYAEHDIIYFGDYESTIVQMTDDEQRAMFTYNWLESEDAWAFYT